MAQNTGKTVLRLWIMSADAEIITYLHVLLDHQADCNAENCPACATMQDVCKTLSQRIFGHPAASSVSTLKRGWRRAGAATKHELELRQSRVSGSGGSRARN